MTKRETIAYWAVVLLLGALCVLIGNLTAAVNNGTGQTKLNRAVACQNYQLNHPHDPIPKECSQ